MAYKTFANGFPLPASDLNNFLMNQSVIVFADSAARTTAIPSPIQGMLTYLVDTSAYESWNGSAFVGISNPGDITAVTAGTGLTGGGTTGDVTLNLDAAAVIPSSTVTTSQDLIVADGASSVTRLGVGTDDQVLSVVAGAVAWADAGGGGMELISSTSLTGSSVTISSIPGTYKKLVMYVRDYRSTSNFAALNLRVNGITSGYANWEGVSGDLTMTRSAMAIGGQASSSVSDGFLYSEILDYANTTTWKLVSAFGFSRSADVSADIRGFEGYSASSDTGAITSITFLPSSGSFQSGVTASIYGVK